MNITIEPWKVHKWRLVLAVAEIATGVVSLVTIGTVRPDWALDAARKLVHKRAVNNIITSVYGNSNR